MKGQLMITYRDHLGIIIRAVDEQYGVSFCDGTAYFTDTDGTDWEISTDAIMAIVNEY